MAKLFWLLLMCDASVCVRNCAFNMFGHRQQLHKYSRCLNVSSFIRNCLLSIEVYPLLIRRPNAISNESPISPRTRYSFVIVAYATTKHNIHIIRVLIYTNWKWYVISVALIRHSQLKYDAAIERHRYRTHGQNSIIFRGTNNMCGGRLAPSSTPICI